MNFAAYPRHWLRLHLIVHRGFVYFTIYLGWGWCYWRWHFSKGHSQ